MKNKKIAIIVSGAMFLSAISSVRAISGDSVRQINPNLILATPTPTATAKPILINPNLIKTFEKIELKFTKMQGTYSKIKIRWVRIVLFYKEYF